MSDLSSPQSPSNATDDDGAIHIPNNPTFAGLARVTRNVAYKTGADDLVMDIIAPQSYGDGDDRRYPTVVFVQGSAWTTPDRDYEVPQLSALARRGYVVASVNHRDATRDVRHVFPAYLQDVKAAIRYLRAHAAEWHVDPARVGIWGTSSGGNTALLVGLTAQDPAYEDGTCPGVSDAVNFVVSCFPPTDLIEAVDAFGHDDDPFRLYYAGSFAAVVGATPEAGITDEVRARAKAMSPYYQVRDGRGYPPMLLLHGTADKVVPYGQSVKMRRLLADRGYEARLVLVDGADHERDFWSQAVLDTIFDFIVRHS